MEKCINISEKQNQQLCKELGRLVYKFKQNEKIECIYFGCYKGLGGIVGNVLELTLVADEVTDELRDKIKSMNSKIYGQENSIKNLGVKLYIDLDNSNKYTVLPLNPSSIKSTNALFNSTILYDKDGKFFHLMEKKNEFFEQQDKIRNLFFVYGNAAELVPPIDESLVEKNAKNNRRWQLKKQNCRYGSHK